MNAAMRRLGAKASKLQPVLKVKNFIRARSRDKISSAQRTLAITELLEAVLEYLPREDLVRARLVSPSFRNTIDNSPTLHIGISSKPAVDTEFNMELFTKHQHMTATPHRLFVRPHYKYAEQLFPRLYMDVEPYSVRLDGEYHAACVLHFFVNGVEDELLLDQAALESWSTQAIASSPVAVKLVLHDRGIAMHFLTYCRSELDFCLAILSDLAGQQLVSSPKWFGFVRRISIHQGGHHHSTLGVRIGRESWVFLDSGTCCYCPSRIGKTVLTLSCGGQKRIRLNLVRGSFNHDWRYICPYYFKGLSW